ncbi:MAG: hypothetical protein JOZ18_02975 [Chloroflexi bacterium]|nr:hypothetical protein [Chloroflexota bacterium]
MTNNTINSSASTDDIKSASKWQNLYPALRSLIRRQVYASRIPSWHGQEDDIVEDILQESARRIIEYAQKAEKGEALPIYLFEHMVMVIASNYCKDMRRRDRRFIRLVADPSIVVGGGAMMNLNPAHFSETAIERAYQEELFILLAHEIAAFPSKQRNALLIDLANRMSFDEQPTPLQKAFLQVGIRLEEYQQPLPEDLKERSKYAALLYHAYKRVAKLARIREYASAA